MTPDLSGTFRWTSRISDGRGKSRMLVSVAAGILAALALPPIHAIPLLIPAFCLLLWQLQGANNWKRAFRDGWFFGIGFFVTGLYWLGIPLVIDVADDAAKDTALLAGLVGVPGAVLFVGLLLQRLLGGSTRRRTLIWIGSGFAIMLVWMLVAPLAVQGRFAWMIPFAVFGLGAGLALFCSLATVLTNLFTSNPITRIMVLPIAWALSEWVRGHVLTGFPWNLIASVWMPVEPVIQSLAWIGPHGLGLLTILIAGSASALAYSEQRPFPGLGLRFGLPVLATILLIGLAIAGVLRIPEAAMETVDNVRLRVVQAAIPQRLKWSRNARVSTLLQHVRLSRAPGREKITHLIWPETATAFRFQTRYRSAQLTGETLRLFLSAIPAKGYLVTGIVRDNGARAWNSIQIINKSGRVLGSYDKHHLVPFGEYVPARKILRSLGIEKIAQGRGDYSSGPGPRTMKIPGAPAASPLVCYEAIFPHEAVAVHRSAKAGPQWLLNVTNDTWFGASAGPHQHFAAARMRAVEQGLPLVRAANSGISAIVDPYGRILAILALGTRGVLDSPLPKAIKARTIYAKLGDVVFVALMIFIAVLGYFIGIISQKIILR